MGGSGGGFDTLGGAGEPAGSSRTLGLRHLIWRREREGRGGEGRGGEKSLYIYGHI